jgi:DNA-directed RNA polymerase specialized sigma24 family protein
METTPTSWPTIDSAYTDEDGSIDPVVYEMAGQVWPHAERLAVSVLRDQAAGMRVMMRAVAIVSRRRGEAGFDIKDLRPYLFRVYKNLVLGELKKQNRRRDLEEQWEGQLSAASHTADGLDRKILIEELLSRMDLWTRRVFEWRVLGYKFEVIGEFLGMEANHVRSAYSKSMARLREDVKGDSK